MKITKEEFNKLSQLDRIEFRQKLIYLMNEGDKSSSTSFIYFIVPISLLMTILSYLHYAIFKSTVLFYDTILILKLAIIITAGLIIVDVIYFIKNKREVDGLYRDFFEIKTKGKRS